MNLVELILLSIIVEFHPGAPVGKEGTDGVFNTYKGGWNKRYFLYQRPPITGRGGTCYGLTGKPDPLWLGNSDLLNNNQLSVSLSRDEGHGGAFYHLLAEFTRPILTVTPIMYKDKPLYGWFHLKLIPKDDSMPKFKTVQLDQVYAHVETENDFFAPAGSFVRTRFNKGGCATVNAESKNHYKPCTYAQDPFILAHNTFLHRTPYGKGVATYEWNVRIDFPLCWIYRKDNPLYFRVLITDINYQRFHMPHQKWIYLKDYNYGAPDPEPPSNAAVDCTKEDAEVPWIDSRGDLLQNVSWWNHDCTAESLSYGLPPKEPQYNWGGRCCIGFSEQYSQKSPYLVPRVDHKYNCRRQSTDKKHVFLDGGFATPYTAPKEDWKYPEIKDYLKQAFEEATKNCRSIKCQNAMNLQNGDGLSASSTVGQYIYAGRQGHGILMVIACLFVYPLTNFVCRYLKGTFMSSRYIVNLHPWYTVHIYGTLTTLTFLVTGVGMGIYARYYLGYSITISGRAHVALGYISFILFLGGVISNGWRYGITASRNWSIILHACFGVVFYYLSLVTIAVAVWIPGSPGGQKKRRDTVLDTIRNSTLVVITLLFPLFEVFIHVIGTMQMRKGDARFSVLRDWAGFVAIPWVHSGDLDDEAGTGLKTILFVVYLVGASVATIVALATIVTSNPEGHYFGEMTYTHARGKLSTEDIETHVEAEDLLT